MSDDRVALPTHLKPLNYNLRIYDLDFDKFTYNGVVVVDYKLHEATDEVQLNYRPGCKPVSATVVTASGKDIRVEEVVLSDEKERVVFKLGEKITEDAQVTVQFSAKLEDNMSGFYRSKYEVNGEAKIMASTQFEATDARRAFPCADEPNLKASLEFTIEIPAHLTALSNMPVKSEVVEGDKKVVVFDKAPIMSTYLYAWAVGEFEYIEAHTAKLYNGKPLPLRVYTTPGLKEQGRLALNAAVKIIDYFGDVFDIPYALPKCDLLAVHEFSAGAMENWGLITYRTTAVLFDEKTSDTAFKKRVTYVVAHELAHQWFGNLVTMDWWNELWLNEGFATWVGWLAVDYLHPEWEVFSAFAGNELQTALNLDALKSSHPIEVPLRDAIDVDQIFDTISYMKGASTIRMLSTYVGVENFLKGVSNYLKKHKFANAKTTDLWAAVGEATGMDIPTMMRHWTQTIGHPIVTVSESADGEDVTLRQDRYLSTGDLTDEDNQTVWWVPLALSIDGPKTLAERELTLKGLGKQNFKLNKDSVSFFRTAYSEARLNKIAANLGELSVNDKVGLIGDAASAASSGKGSTTAFLSLVKKIADSGEQSFYVWEQIVHRLTALRAAWVGADESQQAALKSFIKDLIKPITKKFTWETDTNDFIWLQFRALIFGAALSIDDEEVVAEAKTRFFKYIAGDRSALHASLQRSVKGAVVANSTGEELERAYSYLQQQLKESESVDGKEQAAFASGRVRDAAYIQKSLETFLHGGVIMQDAQYLSTSLFDNTHAQQVAWEFFRENWAAIEKRYRPNIVVIERIVRLALSTFASRKAYDEITEFFGSKDVAGFDRGIEQAKGFIKIRYQWVERDSTAVAAYLK